MNNKVKPSLPNGMVVVDKGSQSRQILVGILDGKRMPAFGFDVRGTAPHHYRKVDFGNFGVMIGAKQPVEVRVLLDGVELVKRVLKPGSPPTAIGMDAELKKRMLNAPTPHYVTEDGEGNALVFNAPDMSIEDYVAQQIHAGVMDAPPTLGDIDASGPVEPHLVFDVDPGDFGFDVEAPDADSDQSVAEHIASSVASLAKEESDADTQPAEALESSEVQPAEALESSEVQPAEALESSEVQPADGTNETLEATSSNDETDVPGPVTMQSRSWAPSHGLVAIGVRMIQHVEEGEMIPTGPDGFVYVQFQLNPWNVHSKVHAKVMGRVIVPSTTQLQQMTIDEGFEDELGGGNSHVSCGLKNHKH